MNAIGEGKYNFEKENLYKQIISETRCMVCQNQNLAESEAPLAIDLKNKIKKMVMEGKTETEIKILPHMQISLSHTLFLCFESHLLPCYMKLKVYSN